MQNMPVGQQPMYMSPERREYMCDHIKQYLGDEVAVEVCREGVCKTYSGKLAYVGDDFIILEVEKHDYSLETSDVEAEQYGYGGLSRILLPLLLIGAFYPRRRFRPYGYGYPYGPYPYFY